MAQKESFSGVGDPRLKYLNAETDKNSGVLRSKTLISNRVDDLNFIRPVILDYLHPLTRVLIRNTHIHAQHANIATTEQILRERVWIISSRRVVREVIHQCIPCRKFSKKPLIGQPASLPENRVKDAEVFEISGIDYAGPLFLDHGKKVWVCLFTCAVYRAVYLEMVQSLSTEGFMDAFLRFVSRRGRPAVIYTDNGTNFTKAATLLKNMDWTKIKTNGSVNHTEWVFNPPAAAWWGGWWERIFRILKDLLKRTLGNTSLNAEKLNTLLCECESVLNNRPITHVSDEGNALLPICPAMFLREIRSDGVPAVNISDKTLLCRKIKYFERLRKEFRVRFRSEYLGQLVRRRKVGRPSTPIKVGDVVFVVNDNTKRVEWPMARV